MQRISQVGNRRRLAAAALVGGVLAVPLWAGVASGGFGPPSTVTTTTDGGWTGPSTTTTVDTGIYPSTTDGTWSTSTWDTYPYPDGCTVGTGTDGSGGGTDGSVSDGTIVPDTGRGGRQSEPTGPDGTVTDDTACYDVMAESGGPFGNDAAAGALGPAEAAAAGAINGAVNYTG